MSRFTFFVDRSFGSEDVPRALHSGLAPGETIITHDGAGLKQDTDDDVWLELAGRSGWIALTKDRLRNNPLADQAILRFDVANFGLARGGLSGTAMGEVLRHALPRIRTAARRYQVPLRATITTEADVIVYLASGRKLVPPKRYTARRARA